MNKVIVLQDDLIPNFEKMIKQGEVKDRISKNCESIATDNLEEKKQNKIMREESMEQGFKRQATKKEAVSQEKKLVDPP